MSRSECSRRGLSRPAVLIAILVIAAPLAIWLWFRQPAQLDVNKGQEVAAAFLANIREGKAADAWQSTTAEFKSAVGKEAFVREVKPLKFLKGAMAFVSTETVMVNDESRSEFQFRAPTGETARIVLGNEGGVWKVDRWMK